MREGVRHMDKFPLIWRERTLGELSVEQEALYTWFTVCCRLPEPGLWCAWAVGEQGELRLGVLEPLDGRLTIRRRFSHRMTEPLGRLVQGELRPAAGGVENWEPLGDPGKYFHSSYLKNQLRNVKGALTRREGECRYVAIPYDSRRPFPLTAMFCFARVGTVAGQHCAVFALNREEWPVIPILRVLD